jgi:hypothetical protein
MSRELAIEERYTWLRATLQHLADIPRLSGADLGYVVFETLDPDVRSGLHDSNLDPLVTAGRISPAMKQELLEVRSAFLPLLEAAYAASSPIENMRHDERWAGISCRCSRLLSSLTSE